MEKSIFRTKLNRERLTALYQLYLGAEAAFSPETAHDFLLKEHGREMTVKLEKALLKQQKKATVKMCGTEAIAFCQYWRIITLDVYGQSIVDRISGEIDQHQKSLKPLINAPHSTLASRPN